MEPLSCAGAGLVGTRALARPSCWPRLLGHEAPACLPVHLLLDNGAHWSRLWVQQLTPRADSSVL